MKRFLIAATLCGGFTLPLLAQKGDLSKTPLDVKQVRGSVYMLIGAGGNIGFSAGEDGVIIIDDQFAPLSKKIREAIRKVSPQPIRFILNTHFHGDHTGGNAYFAQLAPIVAQENVRKRLSSQLSDPKSGVTPKTLPIVTYAEGLTFFLNGEEIRVMHVPPGHTDGDSVIYFTKSNVLHMGDDFFNGRFPFIDLESGGSVLGMAEAVDRIVAMMPADVKVIPGHGPLATLDELRAFSAMLRETMAIVRSGKAAGKTLDELKQEQVLAKYDKLSWEFISTDKFVETLYRDASTKR